MSRRRSSQAQMECLRDTWATHDRDGEKGIHLTWAIMLAGSCAFAGRSSVLPSLAMLPKASTYCCATCRATASMPPWSVPCDRSRNRRPHRRSGVSRRRAVEI